MTSVPLPVNPQAPAGDDDGDDNDRRPVSPELPLAPLRQASRLLQRLASGISSEYDAVDERETHSLTAKGFGQIDEDSQADLQDIPLEEASAPNNAASFKKKQHGAGGLDIEAAPAAAAASSADASSRRTARRRTLLSALLVVLLAAAGCGGFYLARLTDADRDADYLAWKKTYQVDYDTRAENIRRYEIFLTAKVAVGLVNAEANGSVVLETNQFAALTDDEKAAHRGRNPVLEPLNLSELDHPEVSSSGGDAGSRRHLLSQGAGGRSRELLQAGSVDWTSKMAPVVNQGGCGSCYIFAPVAQLEGQLSIAFGGAAVPLSMQFGLDCGYAQPAPEGCNGGDPAWFMLLLQDSYGGFLRADQYKGYSQSQAACPGTSVGAIAGVARFSSYNWPYATGEDVLVQMLQSGPVTVRTAWRGPTAAGIDAAIFCSTNRPVRLI